MRITQDRNQPADLASVTQADAQLAVRKKGDEKQLAAQQGDVIDISEEGRQKSAAMQAADSSAANVAASGEGPENEGGDSAATAGDGASPADLEKKLQSKKSETKRKQQKLDAARRQAEGERGNDAEVQKLKNDVRRLQDEEKKIRAEVYSS